MTTSSRPSENQPAHREWPSLKAMELFVAVIEEGSVGAGARRVGLAQPNASRVIADLEAQVKTSLLDRHARGSKPTGIGLEFGEHARAVLGAAQELNEWLDQLGDQESTVTLQVGASMTIAESLLPAWLASLRIHRPRIQVEVRVANSRQVLELVHDGAIQLGFVETPHPPSSLNTVRVSSDELVVVVSAQHPWARHRGKVTLAELAATPLVVREAGSGTREALDDLLQSLNPVVPAQVLGSNAAVRVAVASGQAPAALSLLAVHSQLTTGELLRVPLEVDVPRPLTAVWQGPRRLRPPASDLIHIAQMQHNSVRTEVSEEAI